MGVKISDSKRDVFCCSGVAVVIANSVDEIDALWFLACDVSVATSVNLGNKLSFESVLIVVTISGSNRDVFC